MQSVEHIGWKLYGSDTSNSINYGKICLKKFKIKKKYIQSTNVTEEPKKEEFIQIIWFAHRQRVEFIRRQEL